MLPRNSSWLRSVFAIVMSLLVCCLLAPAAPAGDLDLAGLAALETSPPVAATAPVPASLDLSGLDELSRPAASAHGLQLSGLQELEHAVPRYRPAAQLVLPSAARPPATVPATTVPAGGFCIGGQCYSSASDMTPKQRRAWKRSQH